MALDLAAAGTSAAALAVHYDLPADFFRLWLGPDLVYSCALWNEDDPADTLEEAQRRNGDFFAEALAVPGTRVLDVGCGWGALAERFAVSHGAAAVVGLNLSRSQVEVARLRGVTGADFRLESWVDHVPEESYGAISCIEATEHFAHDELGPDEKVEVYRAFFDRCASWLEPGGRLGLQLICLDQVGHLGSRPHRGPLSELIRTRIFPEAMPSSLSEMVLAWETEFRLQCLLPHGDHYIRTFRAWRHAARRRRRECEAIVGPEVTHVFHQYFAAAETLFRLREHNLYRVILVRRARPKRWVSPPRPVPAPGALPDPDEVRVLGASPAAVRSHYDVSNDFYQAWLGPSMVYSSGLWEGDEARSLPQAYEAKMRFFADEVLPSPGGRVLDVGCGWGGPMRLLSALRTVEGVGLTVSAAQAAFLAQFPVPGTEVRIESWVDHTPARPYDAILSFGAFEHFARDGASREERLAVYRSFFARCYDWLRPGGRIGLETMSHDDAPEISGLRGRGPMADFILSVFPESLAPHLWELVCGFEPWFELGVLRSDGADFARTARGWLLSLRANEAAARPIVGEDTYRRFRRYLSATEMQFRLGEITNYRVVLVRRPAVRR